MNEAILSGVLVKIYEQISEFAGETYHAAKADIENSYHQYYESYLERHGEVKVYCVGMRKPLLLDDVYVAVQFLNQDTVSRYTSPEAIKEAFRDRAESDSDGRQNGTQVAKDEQFLMLLGSPGVGKSTFLRKVGLEALKGKNGNFEHTCIPVFLELKNFKEDEIDIEALITKEFGDCGFPHPKELTQTALKLGDLLILFDGLDEVPRSNVDNVIGKIRDFVDRYSKNRFIASCRIAAYKGGFTRFTEVEMADFDDSQIQDYIKNWFASTPDPHRHQLDESMETADRCWKTLNASEHSATKELARNPLLLTLLCLVYDRSQNLPRNRATLYAKALDVFLEEWAAEKRVHRGASVNLYLDIADETRMLSEIAAKNFAEDRLFFSKDELITQIQEFGEGNTNTLETFNARKIFETILIDQGLFVERVRDSYSFSHLTFQEYLTAKYIVKDTRSIKGLVKGYLHNEQWREVFLLTAGIMHEADDLLEAMEAEAIKLINTPKLKPLFQWVEQTAGPPDNHYSRFAKREFLVGQYLSLRWFNTIKERQNEFVKYQTHFHRYLDVSFRKNVFFVPGIYFSAHLSQALYQDLYPNLSPNLYQDFYQHVDFYFYQLFSDANKNQFDEELRERITLVERMEQMKVFKGVNLQRMVRRFNEQQNFFKMAGAGESIKPPEVSIHDTWLSVLNITDDIMAISENEIDICFRYFRTIDLIIACKGAARVSPDIWQRIEDRFLTVDSGGTA